MKKVIMIFMFNLVLLAAGPFGLELGKSTIDEVKNKLDCKYETSQIIDGVYPNNGYYLSYKSCSVIDDMTSVDFAFNDDGILVYAAIVFDGKPSYKTLKASLSSKYKITKNVEPFVGDRLSEYALNGEKIILSSPHLSFNTYLNYEQIDFMQRVKKAQAKAKQEKQNQTTNML